ncbi:MAG: serine/threonine-protein phosphatase [Myxococcales bacterium]|nr:serine/threonine-protein phosphatase [Myxococcales bacterium]
MPVDFRQGCELNREDDVLRQKVKLLMLRERELLALRRKHQRLEAWLTLAHSLAMLVDAESTLDVIFHRISVAFKSRLAFQDVLFFALTDGWLSPMGHDVDLQRAPSQLDEASAHLFCDAANGPSRGSGDDAETAPQRAVGLHRFLWHRIDMPGARILFVAGYDRERAPFYPAFDEVDFAQFATSGRQLGLLLRNMALAQELARDKRQLEEFNATLEKRVRDRTSELAEVNRSLETTLGNLREKELHLAQDIEEARHFQQKILPSPLTTPALDVATLYMPLERIGGDIFDVCTLSPKHFRVFIADATGHGVQASMRTILYKAEYDRLKFACRDPHELLAQLNERLLMLFPGGQMMATASCFDLILDGTGADVIYANAGNPGLLHYSSDRCVEIFAFGAFVGIGNGPWDEATRFRLTSGDVLLAFTDGLSEQTDCNGDFFDEPLPAINPSTWSSAKDGLAQLLDTFARFRGATAVGDDITIVMLRLPEINMR